MKWKISWFEKLYTPYFVGLVVYLHLYNTFSPIDTSSIYLKLHWRQWYENNSIACVTALQHGNINNACLHEC